MELRSRLSGVRDAMRAPSSPGVACFDPAASRASSYLQYCRLCSLLNSFCLGLGVYDVLGARKRLAAHQV
eukprot:6179982-Pleurochrysis_carterae.AAC.5